VTARHCSCPVARLRVNICALKQVGEFVDRRSAPSWLPMNKLRILFFAADPLSAYGARSPRLRLDEEVRQIRHRVRAIEHRNAVELDIHLAVRVDDIIEAMRDNPPDLVHFSMHGGSDGLVLVGEDGRSPHAVDAAALVQLFQAFRGDIRLVVLNACFSLSQAEAIAGVIGCAIGTRNLISDDAAITFGASFYQNLALGLSVQAAFDQARAAVALHHPEDRDCVEVVTRPDVDLARLVLLPKSSITATKRSSGVSAPPERKSRIARDLASPVEKSKGNRPHTERDNTIVEQRDTPLVFVSYSHADRKWLQRLRVHLKPLERYGTIDLWDDTRITPGKLWRDEVREALGRARAAVLLITADFLASDFITNDELPPLLAAAEERGTKILPIIIKPCRFEQTEELSRFQAVNPPSKPLVAMRSAGQEELFVRLSRTIELALR
jgi:hypothetical protein